VKTYNKSNLIMLVTVLSSFAFASIAQAQSAQQRDEADINAVLDGYHQAAAEGDWQGYFSLMSDDGVFLGSDASERWEKEEFRAYAAGRSGWTYTPQKRNITITPDRDSAWFDEILLSQSYGTSRGTGVLIRTGQGWKISQYSLSFPIPNPLARKITDEIIEFEAGR